MKTAILIAAHNEELVIARTLQSIKGDVFVASDNSTDHTYSVAKQYTNHVISVNRGGKGRAIRALIERYHILDLYDAFIIIDADTLIRPDTISEFEAQLTPGVAGAVGRMESLNGGLIAAWRAVCYFIAFKLYRRGMAAINSIHIMSGTCAIWRTSAFKHIEWHDSPVEDMDWTYQIHRKKLGKITYAPKAIVYTQEPQTIKSYIKQMLRWYRGYWLTTSRYNTPFGWQTLDISQSIFIFEFAANWARAIAFPLALMGIASSWVLFGFGTDLLLLAIFGIMAAIELKNFDIIVFLPFAIFLYLLDMSLNAYSLLTYRKLKTGIWVSPARLRSINV